MNLHAYDCVLLNTSGGKDSQTAVRYVVQLADEQHYPRERLIAAHADLGRMEWTGVRDLAEEQAVHYGLQFVVVQYRNKAGERPTLLDYIRKRGKWPSSTTRFCTSDFKRGPCGTIFTKLTARYRSEALLTQDAARRALGTKARFLNVFGFRAEESPARAKRAVVTHNGRLSNSKRDVWDWLPIHDWTTAQVWADIRESGVRYHAAYDLGMPRLSCCFCIFAPKPALMIAGRANPELLAEYVAVEKEIGHTFKNNLAIADVAAAIAAGETAGEMDGNWNM